MAKNFTNLNPQHGDDEITLLGKLLQKMGGQPNWGDTVKSLLAKILSAFAAAEQSFQSLSGAGAPVAAPTDTTQPAQYRDTTSGFNYRWDVQSQSWAAIPKVYRALMAQSGVNAPVATVLENTIGNIVWTYTGAVGVYDGTLAGAFLAGKGFYKGPSNFVDSPVDVFVATRLSRISDNVVQLVVGDGAGSGLNGELSVSDGSNIEILVYP